MPTSLSKYDKIYRDYPKSERTQHLMTVYLVTSISLLILGLLYESTNSVLFDTKKKVLPSYFFIIPSFVLLFIISAFRGDFTTDYTNYTVLFKKINWFGFSDVFAIFDHEVGFLFLNRLIGVFTDNAVYLFAITTFIILFGFYHQFNKYSVNIWLSILMFVTVGSYYASFNITRQILAVAIIFMGSRYLYERKFFKYLGVALVASLFHMTALIMVPFYFILNLRIRLKNLFYILIGSVALIVFFDPILSFIQLFVYANYTDNAWGMDGQAIANVVLPIAFLIFTIFHSKKLDSKNNTMHRIWFNAIIFYALFNVLALQVEMVERLGRFFAPYALLLIPFIFSKMQNKYLRFIYMMVLVAVLILYNYITLSDSVFDPYYFIWDK